MRQVSGIWCNGRSPAVQSHRILFMLGIFFACNPEFCLSGHDHDPLGKAIRSVLSVTDTRKQHPPIRKIFSNYFLNKLDRGEFVKELYGTR